VETESIDDFAAANSLKSVNFIKMDIEGSQPKRYWGLNGPFEGTGQS
jgi:hypothetical protein